MIKGIGHRPDGKPIVIVGLSAENVRRLQDDQPIRVELSDLGLQRGTLFIFAGDTEESMAGELAAKIGDVGGHPVVIDKKTPYENRRHP